MTLWPPSTANRMQTRRSRLPLGRTRWQALVVWAVLLMLVAGPAAATILYVDQNHADCSDHTSRAEGTPYCTTAAAFRDLRSGDTMRIRESATPYKLSAQSTLQGPITIEADTGHRPVLTKGLSKIMLTLVNASHWTIQGLTFDGAGHEVRHAIKVDANSDNVSNIRIHNNRFINLGGTGERIKKPFAVLFTNSKWKERNRKTQPYSVSDSIVSDNFFDNCVHGGVSLKHTKNITIANNEMVNFRCGHYRDGRIGVQAVKIESASLDTVIRDNKIGRFQPSKQCPLQPGLNKKRGKIASSKYVAIYCDVRPQGGLITNNVIFDIDPGRANSAPTRSNGAGGTAVGVFIESQCTDWKIRNNLFTNIGRHAFRNGARSTGYADRTEFSHNTIYNIAGDAISIRKGEGLKITHNIIANYGGVAIDFINYAKCQKSGKKCRITKQTQAFHQTSHEINHNLYWTENGAKPVGRWFKHKTQLDFNGWQKATGGYDQRSIYTAPQFVDAAKGNFALQDSMRSTLKTPDGATLGYQAKPAN